MATPFRQIKQMSLPSGVYSKYDFEISFSEKVWWSPKSDFSRDLAIVKVTMRCIFNEMGVNPWGSRNTGIFLFHIFISRQMGRKRQTTKGEANKMHQINFS